MTDQFKRGNLSARFPQIAADQPRKTAAMTDQTQILDVTYGMFSCRLEGFDDSVATMKQIVSYFHDLAGHEAFMGDALLAPDMEEVSRVAGASSRGDVEAAVAAGRVDEVHMLLAKAPPALRTSMAYKALRKELMKRAEANKAAIRAGACAKGAAGAQAQPGTIELS